MVTFVVGELFDSFGDLTQKLNEYSEENYCHFYIKDSKKLLPEEVINPNLIYKHIVYSCIYGGQKPRFRGSGSRSVTSIRHGCTASLYLRVSKDRTALQVRNFTPEHNHEITEDLFRSAAQDKKLPWDLKAEVEELLLLGADKDRLCEYIRHVSKKNLDKKNLFNMYETAVKQQREISRERAVMLIQKAYGVDTEDEAEVVLQQLLDSSKPARRGRKTDQDTEESIEYTYVNEGDESQDGTVVNDELRKLMATVGGPDGDRIVIVQGDEQFEVIDAGNAMEVSEYLEDDDKEPEVIVKQEHKGDDSDNMTFRYVSVKDLERAVPGIRKRAVNMSTPKPSTKYILPESYEPSNKTRKISNPFPDNDDEHGEKLREVKITNLRAEQDKLEIETEVLKLKKNKLFQEIELIKHSKKYLTEKTNWLANDLETKKLKNEKLRLEIAKLKFEMNEN